MQTSIPDHILQTDKGQTADQVLRKCVHCGFCNATCPTYQLTGDELDGPRGRIYLIKSLLEGEGDSQVAQQHLDRCLTCRSCETTCPSGVDYAKLLDIGREFSEQKTDRSWQDKCRRYFLGKIVPSAALFKFLILSGQTIRSVLPGRIQRLIPAKKALKNMPVSQHSRKMLVLDGCVQPALAPATNIAAARVLDRLGISLISIKQAGCCGALNQHLSQSMAAEQRMKNNIDAWWPAIKAGAEAIVITASGCGVTLKEYGDLLKHDPVYAERAQRIAALARDISEVIANEPLQKLNITPPAKQKIAFQAPCSLQHGQKLGGKVESLLQQLGFDLAKVPDSHLCCGSAGSYSILQKDMADQLRSNKLTALRSEQPDKIVTANIGCEHHLQQATSIPICHWITLLDDCCINPP